MKLNEYGPWTEFRIWTNETSGLYKILWYQGYLTDEDLLELHNPFAYININYFNNGLYIKGDARIPPITNRIHPGVRA